MICKQKTYLRFSGVAVPKRNSVYSLKRPELLRQQKTKGEEAGEEGFRR
jgi:hypothetical protein